jgi:hypothetical protein
MSVRVAPELEKDVCVCVSSRVNERSCKINPILIDRVEVFCLGG